MRKPMIVMFLAVFTMAGCSKKTTPSAEGLSFAKVDVTMIEKAATTKDGSTKVYFRVNNGCGQFHKFIEKNSGNTRTITVEAVYKGMICTMDMPIRETTYRFNEKKPGTYYLQFVSGENEFITDTITVR
ncbi:hypothetical protein [Chitinophaga rhizophila]|uniref:Uncharacterized protein n=1 Tax=Chitinophaga rhizophila TaxID=2866212 RepID=A0ABS7GIP9_9BACT|nr:hypothetical protein [Chitinophaga rhizophila]MBW8687564.1 hypothetical protein [Chitinophaga rhizophila]